MLKLRQYQEDDVRRIYQLRGRALVAAEMGLGKTIEALDWMTKIPSRRPVLIVTPSTVKYAWQHEAWSLFKLRLRVLEGQGPRREDARLTDDVIVLNYDILHFW